MTDQSVIMEVKVATRPQRGKEKVPAKAPLARKIKVSSAQAEPVSTGSDKPTTTALNPDRRAVRSAERREAILAAAIEEFTVSGFEGTRLDDVAKRAGVAKGTIYLYFKDKEALFQDLIRSILVPQVAMLEVAQGTDLPIRMVIEAAFERLVTSVLATQRRDVLRLMITEGHRFPALSEFYYHEVVERGIAAMRLLLSRAVERGELPNDALVRFPQLLVAPMLMSLVWGNLFGRFAPLDVAQLLKAHLDLIFGGKTSS